MNLVALIIITIGTLFAGWVTYRCLSTNWQKCTLITFSIGVYIYSGVGGSYYGVSNYYILFYFVFIFVFFLAYVFFLRLFRRLGWGMGLYINANTRHIDNGILWGAFLVLYLFLCMFPLIYPEYRLGLIFNPPHVNLTAAFDKRFQSGGGVDVFTKIIFYFRLLFSPFFYIAIYKYRNNVLALCAVLFFVLYLNFVEDAYISRGESLTTLALVVLFLWLYKPWLRKRIFLCMLLLAPMVMVVAAAYTKIRLGADVGDVNYIKSIQTLLKNETSYPLGVGVSVIQSNFRANILSYMQWIITLPIPKVITGNVSSFNINYEISNLVLGGSSGDAGWYVVLPGLVVESIYLFGNYFFWMHALFVAMIAAFFVRLLERVPSATFLLGYIVIFISYDLNRAGISAVLPTLINGMLLFYLWLFVAMSLNKPRGRSH